MPARNRFEITKSLAQMRNDLPILRRVGKNGALTISRYAKNCARARIARRIRELPRGTYLAEQNSRFLLLSPSSSESILKVNWPTLQDVSSRENINKNLPQKMELDMIFCFMTTQKLAEVKMLSKIRCEYFKVLKIEDNLKDFLSTIKDKVATYD